MSSEMFLLQQNSIALKNPCSVHNETQQGMFEGVDGAVRGWQADTVHFFPSISKIDICINVHFCITLLILIYLIILPHVTFTPLPPALLFPPLPSRLYLILFFFPPPSPASQTNACRDCLHLRHTWGIKEGWNSLIRGRSEKKRKKEGSRTVQHFIYGAVSSFYETRGRAPMFNLFLTHLWAQETLNKVSIYNIFIWNPFSSFSSSCFMKNFLFPPQAIKANTR